MDLKQVINSKIDEIKEIRKLLSENAELSYQEFKTQGIVMDILNSASIHNFKCANTGVVGILNEGEECIAIRADMDALPVNGVFHACGHDYHMAVALGCALVLKEIGYEKCVKFIFQPAEEAEGGAIPMIKEGVLENPKVKNMIGFHVWPDVPVGSIAITDGASMASIDDFYITIKGKGGHAAMPHLCKNPIFPAIEVIDSVTKRCKAEIDPLNSHVVTFSTINGGKASNVIPDEVTMSGTVRTFDNELRNTICKIIKETSNLTAEKYGCSAEINYTFEYEPLISDKNFTDKFIECTKEILGEEAILPLVKTFGGEDFAFFAKEVPSVHFRLGISNGKEGIYSLHSPNFCADDNALFYGIYAISNFILKL